MSNKSGRPHELDVVHVTATPHTLTHKDSGKLIVISVADCVVNLPAMAPELAGCNFEIVVLLTSATTGLSISPSALDKIQGKAITALDNKDYINTQATEAVGDLVRLVGDGTLGWIVTDERGTWARES